MYAVAAMDPTVQAIFYAVAVVLFVLAAVGVVWRGVSFVAAGLAVFSFVFFWNALAAT
jgi:hypothetical protein